ncbi:hypothetical protein KSP40_PGU009508 [Platanthera guangdongensis]|uniref:HMA domain-containing protein n=1 Tax=Platanthera guangdongensis TaxID=2320717 RepID=A0ABR2MIT0_9ASPA
MAAISFHSSSLCLRTSRFPPPASLRLACHGRSSAARPSPPSAKKTPALKTSIRAVAGEETLAPEADPARYAEENVAVPVSPSDFLKMFFQAEGTMDDAAISKVSGALEGKDGVGDLKVQNLEGIASVELTQETTVQATGVASNLVEIIQAAGFKLQRLSLSFEDEEEDTAK